MTAASRFSRTISTSRNFGFADRNYFVASTFAALSDRPRSEKAVKSSA
jgi:hypothetical protein